MQKNVDNAIETLDVADLVKGMFVSDLDRPWLGTPFLMQGFLIDDDEQIEQLRALCRVVQIDRRRCIGPEFAEVMRRRERQTLNRSPTAVLVETLAEDANEENSFFAIARRLRQSREAPAVPRARPPQQATSLETELLYSAPVFDDVHRALHSIRDAVDSSGNPDLGKVCGLVDEMAAGVERNPDAMLWLTRLKITDQYSYDHAVDVSVHLMVFARFLGLSRLAVECLGQAGLMQDIGKIQIDQAILGKVGLLTEHERRIVQSHVASSLEILSGRQVFFPDVLGIVAAHHERHDGSGYPRALRGDALSLHAELAGLIDVYCAMTRDRVYRDAVSSQKALEKLTKMRGTAFREAVVDQFVQCVGLYPIGTLLELNSGEVAVVIQQNQVRRLKPRVLVLLDELKHLKRRPRSLDLMLEPATPTGEPYRIVRALPSNAHGIDPAEFFLER